MPWCQGCSRFFNPTSLTADGACPSCERSLAPAPERTPWHFKLLVVALGTYLGWRLVQGLAWLARLV